MQSDSPVDITKFRKWVSDNVSPDDPLYKLMQGKDNSLPATEAAYLTTTIFKLIEVAKLRKSETPTLGVTPVS